MKIIKKTLVALLAVLLAGQLAGCSSIGGTILSGEEKDAVLAFSEAKTDNLLKGLNDGDYAVFSKDFDQVMLKAMPAGFFNALKQDRDAKLGHYISRQVEDVAKGKDGFYTVMYDAVFEKDKDVIMRVVFRADDPHQVSGLWFHK